MIRPEFLRKGETVTEVGQVLGAPLVVKGITWLPVAQVAGTWMFARRAQKLWPGRSQLSYGLIGFGQCATLLGSEWCHNLGHAFFAYWLDRPMDAMRVIGGMPTLVYYDVNDQQVSPREHQIRALGGPLVNMVLLLIAFAWRLLTRRGSVAWEMADTAVTMNTFLSTAGFLPLPVLDGGTITKWALIEQGQSMTQAVDKVRQANQVAAAGLAVGTAVAAQKRKWLWAVLWGLLSFLSLAFGLGWLREPE